MSAGPTFPDMAAVLRAAADHHRAGRLDEAERGYAQVLAASPGNADALHLDGVIALQRGDAARAARQIASALARNPRLPDAAANLGLALRALGRLAEAEAAFGRALDANPRQLPARLARAAVRRDLGDFAGAATDAETLLALAPPGSISPAQAATDRARICDWSRREADLARLRACLEEGGPAPSPLVVLALLDDPALQRRMGETLVPPAPPPAPQGPVAPPDRPVRVGVLSGECGDTAVWRLAVEAVELLDRSRIEPVCFAWGPPREGPMRRRVEAAFARFHDCAGLDDAALVERTRRERLDIAVDAAGYTRWARPGLFAARIAPVQVNWLAWPATMGTEWHDYIISDPIVTPQGSDAAFTEAVVRLPASYQPNDRQRAVAEPAPSRAAAGLPPDGFVFACFNQPYKITPEVFEIWMSLLGDVPGSVLWLIDALPQAGSNLRAAAQRAGIAPERLVFAPPLPGPQHLARHALADLALDTWPYGGHTTTSDALWAGLPVLACPGESFASRVSASLLNAAGMGDLVAASPAAYAARALELARSPGQLAALRDRTRAARGSALFDTPAHARALEAAFAEMHRRRCAGQPPGPFTISAPQPPPPPRAAPSGP